MFSYNFTKKQSSAIVSIIIGDNTVKVRFRTSPTAYTYEATHSTILDIMQTAKAVKKDSANNSIGQLISRLMKEEKLVRIPFKYKFDKTITIGHENNQLIAKSYALRFKTAYYSFFPNPKDMTIVKVNLKKNGKDETEYVKTVNITKARKIWINLTKAHKPTETIEYITYQQ